MSEINMVPFINVMLVLLIIFMVTAPLITTGVVDLPSVGSSKAKPQSVIELVVGLDERVKIKVDGQAEPQPVTMAADRHAREAGAEGRGRNAGGDLGRKVR